MSALGNLVIGVTALASFWPALLLGPCHAEHRPPSATGAARQAAHDKARSLRSRGVLPSTAIWSPARPQNNAIQPRQFIGKEEKDVSGILGASVLEEEFREDGHRYRVLSYGAGTVRVGFRNGTVDWLTYYPPHVLPFDLRIREHLGLPLDARPTASTPFTIRWQRVAGLREVSVFAKPGGRGVESVHVLYR